MQLNSPDRQRANGMPYLHAPDGSRAGAIPRFWIYFEADGRISMGAWLLIAPNESRHHAATFDDAGALATFQAEFIEDPEATLAKHFHWRYSATAPAAPRTLTLEDLGL